MDEREQNQMVFQQAVDQLGAQFRDIAPQLGRYYAGLIASGIPGQLAADLVLDAQAAILHLLLTPRPAQEGQ